MTGKVLNQNNEIKKLQEEVSPTAKKDESSNQKESQINLNVSAEGESGTFSSSNPVTSYVSSSHIAYNNCAAVHNMNSTLTPGGLTTTHYYSPILNTPQSLLRPLVTTQPPLYSPILPAQQHSYGLSYPSPSTVSLSNITDSIRSMESLSSADAVFKEVPHHHSRPNSVSSDKSCSVQSSKQYMLDSSQKRSNLQNSCSLARFPSCGEVVAKTNNFYEQPHIFEEYIRMYSDDNGCKAWAVDSSSSNSALQSSNLHRTNSYANHHHQSGSSLNVHGYSDCRLDSSWNRYISGAPNAETYSTDDGSSNPKTLLRGLSLGSNNYNNVTPPTSSDHNLARAHLEYQAISAGQIASILSYVQPSNYQQSGEERSECRVSDARPTTESSCGITTEIPNEPALEAPKKTMDMSNSSNIVTSHHITVSNSVENAASPEPLPSSSDIQPSVLPHILPTNMNASHSYSSSNAIQTTTSTYLTMPPIHSTLPKTNLSAKKTLIDNQQSSQSLQPSNCSITPVAGKFPTKTPAFRLTMSQEAGKKNGTKSGPEDMNTAATFCMLCCVPIGAPSTHSLIDSLITVPSKISVSEKLALMLGCPLPREMLPSQSICPKCFHLINEVDVLEHRLKVCRREVMLSIETMFERNDIQFSPYKRFQRQQYVGSYPHQEMQHTTHQHLGNNVMASQNSNNNNHNFYQNDTQNYHQSLAPIYQFNQNNQNHVTHQGQMHLTQNYHQHNIYLHAAAHSQVSHHSQDHMALRPQEHSHELQNGHFNNENQNHNEQHIPQIPPLHPHHHMKEQHIQSSLDKIPQETNPCKEQRKEPQEHLISNAHSTTQSVQLQPQQAQHLSPTLQSSELSVSVHEHHTSFNNLASHLEHPQHATNHVQKHHYQANSDLNLPQTIADPPSGSCHLTKPDNDLQGFKCTQFPAESNEPPVKHKHLSDHADVRDTHTSVSYVSSLSETLQIKKDKEPPESSTLLLENNHHIPLILPENSDSLTSHPMSVFLYPNSLERDSGSLLNNFAPSHSIRSDPDVIGESQPLKDIPEPVPNSSASKTGISPKIPGTDVESWNQCRDPVIDSATLNTNSSSINHAECDIDIEECDNIIENVSTTQHDQLATPCSQEVEVDGAKVENRMNQPNFQLDKENSHENHLRRNSRSSASITSAPRHFNIYLPSPSSSPRPLGHVEGLRNVQDATEYHKPTLLGKNIKAKKHAKLQICRQCDQVFSNRQALIRHIERRHKSLPSNHSCESCHKRFNSERNLKQHTLTHKTYSCKICSKVFLKKNKLKKHVEEHTQPSLTCKTCSKVTGSMQALISHLKTHDRVPKSFFCRVCSKTFTCKRNLNQHSLIHTGEKPFTCENCGRGFRNRSNMVNHYSICAGKFRFICATCGKGFLLKSLYERHLAEHEGHYAHKCSICHKGFSKSSDLRHHFGTHGVVTQSHTNPCSLCAAPSSSGCNSNAKLKDTKTICEICGKGINRKDTMRDHLSFHAGERHHECHLCSMAYFYKSNLTFHIKTVHYKKLPFPCTLCRKVFSRHSNYELHMRTHTGERPFKCMSCGKAFTSSSNYKRHLKCHLTHPPLTTCK